MHVWNQDDKVVLIELLEVRITYMHYYEINIRDHKIMVESLNG